MANRMSSAIHMAAADYQEARELIQDVVCRLKATLATDCGLTVSSVTCGGSLSLGTCCTGRFDSELIIYSSDIDPKDIERNGYGEWLNKLDRYFQSDEVLSECYQLHAVTDTALEFMLDGVEVELMVSPHWGVPANLYTYMEMVKPHSRTKYFFCAGKWQLQFLKQQPNQDYRQEFICRAMAWRELKWSRSTGGQGRPSAYLLSLLVLKAHQDALKRLGVFSSLSPDTMAHHTTEELKRIVLNHQTMDIWWEHCYSLKQYPALVPPRPPRILDPANPANNLYVTGMTSFTPNERQREHKVGSGNWSFFKNHIGSLDLSKPVQHWI